MAVVSTEQTVLKVCTLSVELVGGGSKTDETQEAPGSSSQASPLSSKERSQWKFHLSRIQSRGGSAGGVLRKGKIAQALHELRRPSPLWQLPTQGGK